MALVFAHVSIVGHEFYLHTLVAGSLFAVVGSQLIGFGLCGRTYAVYHLGERDAWLERMQLRYRLEHGLLAGAGLAIAGFALESVIVGKWFARGLGSLAEGRWAVLGATLVIIGVQIFFTAFLLSILGLRRPRS
jgi:hypothetical protein